MQKLNYHTSKWGLCVLIVVCCHTSGFGAARTRTEIPFPDLAGHLTLRCDFHLHTVFSDGNVWPPVRVEEAWRAGLDAIALTDHIEYLPHRNDVSTNYARPYDLARPLALQLGMLLIRGAEITRGEPPGHLNALFLTNVAALNHPDYRVAISNAFAQGGFLFWNHPAWKQPDKKAVWYAEQGEFYTNGWLRGIEVVNGDEYDAIAHGWCLEKKLAILGNSDAHDPVSFDFSADLGEIRPLTLVFAKERSTEAIRQALIDRKTVVVSEGRLIGDHEWLEPLFHNSIKILNPEIRMRGKSTALVQIRNSSAVSFDLRLTPKLPELDVPDKLRLPAGKISLLQVRCVSDRVTGKQVISLACRVTNALSGPEHPLRTSLQIPVTFEAR